VKRISADGTVQSNEFPPGVEPKGSIAVGGGAAWVPIEGGVLRFDPTTGAYRDRVSLAGWNRIRLVQLGTDVYAYPMFGTQLARLDATAPAPSIVDTEVSLVSVAATRTGLWALTWANGRGTVAPLNPISGAFEGDTNGVTLPRRFVGSELQASGASVWVLGTLTDSQDGVLRLDTGDRGVVRQSRLVMFRPPNGSAVLGLDGDEVLVAADGELHRVAIR